MALKDVNEREIHVKRIKLQHSRRGGVLERSVNAAWLAALAEENEVHSFNGTVGGLRGYNHSHGMKPKMSFRFSALPHPSRMSCFAFQRLLAHVNYTHAKGVGVVHFAPEDCGL
ncbi:hypothetical protein M8C21_018938 [Ambrosia artemisiifolia]|uniref:Uncharacterized protein n=1 Tax=Ambrosia artemisiifolia TaxID=4212 RepID=A0AAD5GXD8_AMBAR|nr:hypothetical protein M8C21_018938 [Ambrosia artemisiifolia]